MRTIYINGQYFSEAEAKISVFDRGYLFSDSIYEVSAIMNGQLVDNKAHLARLYRSLGELRIDFQMTAGEIEEIQHEIVSQNNVSEGIVYIQVSRGSAERDFLWPADITPNIVMFTQEKNLRTPPLAERGARVCSVPDIRWQRRDIKTTSLLAQALAKDIARQRGCDDAWMVNEEDGFVTEGTSTNAFIITSDGRIVTRQLSNDILHGVTRQAVLEIANALQLTVEERPFSAKEVETASEAFATGSSFFVLPVVEFDTVKIGDGTRGPVTQRIRDRYVELTDRLNNQN